MTRKLFLVLLPLVLAACSGGEEAAAPPPPAVTVSAPLVREVRDWDEYIGRFEAIDSVEVRPRATGYLQRVHFTDGDFVRKGEVLFTIDPREAQAGLDQARAQLARAEAVLANARTELTRSQTLAEASAASAEEVEQRQATVRSSEAEVNAARAAVRAQRLGTEFTTVRAPISGRVSERMVDPGNSVVADQTVLTRIVSVSPMHFAFEGSEALLLKYQREDTAGAGTPVRVRLQDEARFTRQGSIDFFDPVVNPGSGTVRGRAVIPNADGFLKPGMVGRLQLAGTEPYRAMLVPDAAIQTDAARRIVLIVDKEGVVAAKTVQLGPLVGDLRVIRDGIAATDRVVISGMQRARPGQPVTPQAGEIDAAALQAPDRPAPPPPPATEAQIAGQ